MGRVENKTGAPVRGDDFFDREREIEQIFENLGTDSLLLLAPRRVGKTSLMMRLRQIADTNGYHAAFFSAQELPSELAFVEKLYSSVSEVEDGKMVLQALKKQLSGIVGRLKKLEIGKDKVAFELSDPQGDEWVHLGSKLIRALGKQDRPWLLMVDELPVFVLKLLAEGNGLARAKNFLYWMRGLRTGEVSSDQLRWLIAGSIGLDAVTRRLNLGDTISDLAPFEDFGPFSPEVADQLLGGLSVTYSITIPGEVKEHIRGRIGWLIPFYLQLIFQEIRSLCPRSGIVSVEQVDDAYEILLTRRNRFDWWEQRLNDELGKPDNSHALEILNAISQNPNGESGSNLKQLMSRRIQNPDERDAKLRYLLEVLRSDGYLVRDEGRYRFRSPLLRDYWTRKEDV